MKLWNCLNTGEQEWLMRYQRKHYGTEINPPDAEKPPALVIPVHITEEELRELRQVPHHPRGEGYRG